MKSIWTDETLAADKVQLPGTVIDDGRLSGMVYVPDEDECQLIVLD